MGRDQVLPNKYRTRSSTFAVTGNGGRGDCILDWTVETIKVTLKFGEKSSCKTKEEMEE
jgi:hypothetical protein